MSHIREFKKSVVARVERDSAFAKALLDDAATLILSGEAEIDEFAALVAEDGHACFFG